MNILVNLPPTFFTATHFQHIWNRLRGHGEVRFSSHDTPDEIHADLEWADAVFMWSWPVLSEPLLQNTHLKFRGHLDLNQTGARIALESGVPTSLSKGGWSPAVAEMALGLALNLLRHISTYHAQMRVGSEKWVESFPADIDPRERELTGANVGIIGLGQVGRRLAELLAPFKTHLRVYDPFLPAELALQSGATLVSLEELLSQSEIVVLCAASNNGSKHLLGREEIALLPTDAILINVARSALVDYDALAERLRKGDLWAALDVFDAEPLPADWPYRTLENLFLTPHRAGGTMQSVERTLEWLVDDFEAVLKGKAPKYALHERAIVGLDTK